jgi:hypothetical protein
MRNRDHTEETRKRQTIEERARLEMFSRRGVYEFSKPQAFDCGHVATIGTPSLRLCWECKEKQIREGLS